MIRIGIVGSDNSHAQRFPELTNLEDWPAEKHVEGAKVVAIWGRDDARTQEVAEAANIPNIVSDPSEMLDMVDAAMVVFRHGGLHREYAEPFLEAGIPTFVDKPLAVTVEDAQALIDLAERTGTPMTSFSTLRFDQGVKGFIKDFEQIGPVRTAIYTSHGDTESEYGGLIFYSIHAIEMMMAAHGPGIKEVRAYKNGPNFIALLGHENGLLVALNVLATSHGFILQAYGDEGHKIFRVTGSDFYIQGLKTFLEMVRTGEEPIPHAEMVESIRVAKAVEQALETDRPISL
jgi:predicted dehydrogenase